MDHGTQVQTRKIWCCYCFSTLVWSPFSYDMLAWYHVAKENVVYLTWRFKVRLDHKTKENLLWRGIQVTFIYLFRIPARFRSWFPNWKNINLGEISIFQQFERPLDKRIKMTSLIKFRRFLQTRNCLLPLERKECHTYNHCPLDIPKIVLSLKLKSLYVCMESCIRPSQRYLDAVLVRLDVKPLKADDAQPRG